MRRRSFLALGALGVGVLSLCAASGRGQASALRPAFDAGAVEGATLITGRTCANPVVGIAYDLPEGMQIEDASGVRAGADRGERLRTGMGPEAHYILYWSGARHTMAILCGAASGHAHLQLIAIPQSALRMEGHNALEMLVMQLGRGLGLQGGSPRQRTIAGRAFEYAESEGRASAGGQRIKLFAAVYATEAYSYGLIWEFDADDSQRLKAIVDSLTSVKLGSPAPRPAAEGPAPRAGKTRSAIAPDFRDRLAAFLTAWLAERDRTKTLSFIAPRAYRQPAIIGAYCSGWYETGMPAQQAERIIAENLMGVPGSFPRNSGPEQIFRAWDRLPPEWIEASANDVAKEYFLIAEINRASLGRLFRDQFAGSDYDKFLQKEADEAGSLYWAVFPDLDPDGDVFVIFTLWQKLDGAWSIVHIDAVCQ